MCHDWAIKRLQSSARVPVQSNIERVRMSWNSAEASAYVLCLLLLCQGSKWGLMVRASDQYSSGLGFESGR